jgi:hypothetical protein
VQRAGLLTWADVVAWHRLQVPWHVFGITGRACLTEEPASGRIGLLRPQITTSVKSASPWAGHGLPGGLEPLAGILASSVDPWLSV